MGIMEVEPNARILVHQKPPAAPGKCVVCGFSGDDENTRTFVDFGFDIDYYGVVYFCSLCMTEVANAIGYVNGDQFMQIQKENYMLNDRIMELTDERDSSVNALRAFLNGHPGIGNTLESEELPKKSEPIKQPSPKKPIPKSKVSNDVNEQGPNDSGNSDGDIISLG